MKKRRKGIRQKRQILPKFESFLRENRKTRKSNEFEKNFQTWAKSAFFA